ncbi:MAG: tetratricopeptide repeat protein [Treponema sp.]|jgi:tetratricopeptide (TPR) repeat protein|nr:tetratricopeptide repeat protein [Treponema sp.]
MKNVYPYGCIGIFFLFLFSGIPGFSQVRPDALQEYRNGNFERAVNICGNEIAANPRNLESHVVMCWSLIRLNRYDEALTYAQAGRNISRYDIRIIEILGEAYFYLGRNNESLQFFQEYINRAPEGGRIDTVYYFIGEIYIRLGRFRHADISLSTAVHYMPGNAIWWTRLAYARENAGDLQEAINAYERALSLDSQLSDARRGLDRIRQALGRR